MEPTPLQKPIQFYLLQLTKDLYLNKKSPFRGDQEAYHLDVS